MTLHPLQPGLSAFERCPLKKPFSRRKCSGTIGQYPKWHSEKPYSSEDTTARVSRCQVEDSSLPFLEFESPLQKQEIQ
jgi:hypothetical protein